MRGCEDYFELLSAHIDGELTVEEASRLEDHLRGCEACRRELADMQRVWDGLGVLEDVEPSSHLAARVLDRTLTDASAAGANVPRRRWLYPAAAVAAVLFIAVVAGYVLQDRTVEPPRPAEEVAAAPANGDADQIVKNMDLLENLDVLTELDAKDLDTLAEIGEGVLTLPEEQTTDDVNGGKS